MSSVSAENEMLGCSSGGEKFTKQLSITFKNLQSNES